MKEKYDEMKGIYMQYLNESELKDAGIDIGCKIDDAIKSPDRFLPQPGFSTSRMYNEDGELWISKTYARVIADRHPFKRFKHKNPINSAKTKKINKDMNKNSKPKYKIKYTNEFLNENFKVMKLRNGDTAVAITSSDRYGTKNIYTDSDGCPDNTNGKLNHNKNYYDIRQVCYCLRTGSHYLDAVRSVTSPEIKDNKENAWKFKFDEVVVKLPDGTEWKDYKPEVIQSELNFPEDVEEEVAVMARSSTPTRKDVMEYCNTPNKWDVVVNGTTFSFFNKETMIEMCREIAIK